MHSFMSTIDSSGAKKKRKKRPNFFAPLDERPASFLHLR